MRLPCDQDVVISGISGRYPKSANLQEFWDNLVNSVEMSTEEKFRWDSDAFPAAAGFLSCHDQFDHEIFGYPAETANHFDPQLRLFHETTYEALYDAGLNPFSTGDERAACFIGTCYNDSFFEKSNRLAFTNKAYYDNSFQAACKVFNLKAVSFSVDTACAASFSALHQAIMAFKTGEIDFAVIGGLAIQLKPQITIGFTKLRMLSPEGKSRSLDANVNGYCRSEAVVTIILQRRKDAKRIYSSIYHTDSNCDGYKHEGITFPSAHAQYVLMKKFYEDCKIDPERYITYVEGHITGTIAGDPVETSAIAKAMRPNKSRPLLMGCLKSNMGHSEGASAMCAISKIALIFQQGFIPPNINYQKPNPNIPELKENLIVPILEKIPFDEDLIALNAFGFGGVNVHAILRANEKQASPEDYEIFNSKYKLRENWFLDKDLHDLNEFERFSQNAKDNMIRLVNLTNRTVEGCNYAISFIEKNRSKINNDFLQLIEDQSFIEPETKLNHHAYFIWGTDGKIISNKIARIDRKRPLYLIFSGLGSQWIQMGTDLLQIKPFARKIIELNQVTVSKFKFSLIDFITQKMTENDFNKDLTKQLIAISSVQMALVDLLRFLEIDIKAFIGHSVGEYACAYADGCATSEEIIESLFHVSNICKTQEKGSMASVGLSQKKCEERLTKNLSICCYNSSENVTIGGPTDSVDAFLKELDKEEIFTRKVESCGQVFHAKSYIRKIYSPILKQFDLVFGTKKLQRSSKWISTSIEKNGPVPETLAEYLANNLINPVYFRDAVGSIQNDSCCLEVGPHAQLLPLIKQEKGRYVTCLGLMKRGEKDKNITNFFIAIGELFNNGIVAKISKLFTPVHYPVSKQTLSISHLIKFDHSLPKTVYKYPEFHNSSLSAFNVSISYDDPIYKPWYSHVIDGRILLPATGFLYIALNLYQMENFLSKKVIISPEFFDVNFKRAVVLSKTAATEIVFQKNMDNGNFSIVDSSGQICCTGFIKPINDNDVKINHLFYKPNENERLEVIKKEDVYKELRVRGYDYQGDFQGIVEVNANGREGKVKFNGSWVAFTDALLQVSILGEKSRCLFVPTQIEYLRFETSGMALHNQKCAQNNEEPIFDVYYDKDSCVGATNGLLVKGVKVTEATRRAEKQKATLEEYIFVPYQNRFKLTKDVAKKLDNYQKKLSKLIEGYLKKIKKLEEVDLDMNELKDCFNDKEKHSVLNLVLDVLSSNYLIEEDENKNEILEEKSEDKIDLNELIKEREEELHYDLLFVNNNLQLLRNQIANIIENLNLKQLKILEINQTSSFLMDEIVFLINTTSQIRTEYNLMNFVPTLKSVVSKIGINKILDVKSDFSISDEIDASNIVVYKHWTTGYVNTYESLNLNSYKPDEEQEKQLIKNAFDHLIDGGFIILCFRKKLTHLEEQLMKLGNQDNKVKMAEKEKLLDYIKQAGFEYIGEEEAEDETACCSILARKVLKNLVEIEEKKIEDPLEPIPIEAKLFDYSWVVKVKKQLAIKSKKRIWLVAKDTSMNGIIGMVKCIKKEPEGERIRCLFNIDTCNDEEFIQDKIKNGLLDQDSIIQGYEKEIKKEEKDDGDLTDLLGEKNPEKSKDELEEEQIEVEDENAEELKKLITEDLINKDLAMNIICNEKLGCYRQKKVEEELSEETEFAEVDCLTKGDLSSFRWLKSKMKECLEYPSLLYPTQAKHKKYKNVKPFMVDIYYSALNFKDVMVASGRVPGNAYPTINKGAANLIGMEFSGKLTDSGKRVMGSLPGSGISTKFLLFDKAAIFEIPAKWSLADAATVPIVYMTAYYSLFIRGNLLSGEKVLIHAGSGGVGFAAISICLAKGCEVFTTVSTKEKKEFLQKHFPALKDRNFANSRDVNFEEHILKETNGYGVDIVLNSLAEEKLRASIRCLAKFGRFLEIGKYDIISNNPIDTTALSDNRTFHCICLAHLLAESVENPNGSGMIKWNKTCELVKQGIENGEVKPLNYTLFPKEECEQAFRFMANGKHMGKVLIEIRKEDSEHKKIIIKAIPKVTLIPAKSYIITGGLGGFGLELALWMVQIGCRQLVITSRFGIKNTYQEMQVRKMKEKGCNVLISNEICDTLESSQKLLDQANSMGKLGGIFHLAMVLDDAIFTNQSIRLFNKACKSKINPTFFLDYLTRDLIKYNQLDYFICFSSLASAIGNPGQTNYGFANSAMERIVEKRTKDLKKYNSQCKNIAIQWGAIGDVGAFAEKFGNDVSIGNMIPQRILSCTKVMNEVMNYHIPVLSSLILQDETKLHSLGAERNLVKTIMHVLGINDPSTLNPNVTLNELGLDSLMAVEIKQGLEREYDIVMTTQEIHNLTFKRLQEISLELEDLSKNKRHGQNENEDEKDSLAALEEIFNSKDDILLSLHESSIPSNPIFFVPDFEGDFVTLGKIFKYILRPAIGINWTNEFDGKKSLKEICEIIVKCIIEKYPNINEIDLVGLGFGTIFTLELAHQFNRKSIAARKVFFLDGSPKFINVKLKEILDMFELENVDEDKIMTALLLKLTKHLLKVDRPEELEERLFSLPDLNMRIESVIQLIESKFNFRVDSVEMRKQIKRMYIKCKMLKNETSAEKIDGDILLIRPSENSVSINESYEIERYSSGKTEVTKMNGDHRTFIANNAKEVGGIVDINTFYLSI